MATCPDCGTRNTTITLTPTGTVLVAQTDPPASLAGVQPKYTARAVTTARLACDPALGGCGWHVDGRVVDDGDGPYLIPNPEEN